MLTIPARTKVDLNTPLPEKDIRSAGSEAWHVLSIDQALERLKSDAAQGLSSTEATRRLAEYGANALTHVSQRSMVSIFVAQFLSFMVALLIAAMVIAFAMGDSIEAAAILVVIVINAAIGFLTEWKAEGALSALQKQSVPMAQVIRNGVEN